MEAKLEKIENSEAYISIEVDAQKMDEGFEEAYRKVVKQVTVPGFRRGRVPRPLLEAHFGKEILYQDALEYIVPDAYEAALKELDIQPIAQPDFEIDEIEAGVPFKFNVKVAVKPDVKLGDVEGLEVKIPRMEITDEDVEKRLQDMRARYARIEEKTEAPAEYGDTVTIDFQGFVDEEAFAGGSGNDYPLELGTNTFIPGFEDQLIGVKNGESRDVKVTFPKDYHSEDLAGKEALFKVEVKKIETRQLRDLDDELAQEISQFDTIAELRQDVENNLKQMMAMRRKELVKQEVLDKALEVCEISVADAVIRDQIERMKEQFNQRLASQGLTLDMYYQYTGGSEEDLVQDMWPEAQRTVKVNFLLEKLAEEKGFEVTDEEVDKHIEDVAGGMGMDPDQAKQNLAGIRKDLEFSIKMDKAAQFLIDAANVIEEEQVDEEQDDKGVEEESPQATPVENDQ
ncbi:trigger factor [Syntrophomonas erecta]